MNFLVKSLNSEKLKHKIFAGIFFGLLFYIYFYGWSFALALNGCLWLILLFKKDFFAAKKVLGITIIGLALGAYNLIKLFLSLNSAAGKQTAYFMWAAYGRAPIFSKIGFIALIIFALYYFYKRRTDKNWPVILAVILSGWLALNQQIISGRIVQYGHYYFYFIVPLSIIISFYMVWQLLSNEKIKKYLFILLIALVFINTAGGQYKSFFVSYASKKHEQSYRPIIDVLNSDKKPGVILADVTNEYLFTIYTPHDLFWQQIATISQIPTQRLKDALFVYYYLNKEARNDFKNYLTNIGQDQKARGTYYKVLFRNLEGLRSGYDFYAYQKKVVAGDEELIRKRPVIIEELSREYEENVLKNKGINKILRQYGVNYIVWDKKNNPEWDLSGLESLKLLASNNNIYLCGF
ncbi:MAG: hypothetical protein AABX98_00640, partial [Nanoarchaeota archaeon]